MPEQFTATPFLGSSFDEAFAYAAGHHRRQLRKGTAVPYVAHLLAVSSLVLEMGGTQDEAIGGLLHDVVEDGGGTAALAFIRDEFGEVVADIVLANSDTLVEPKPPWRERKETYIRAIVGDPESGVPPKDVRALRVSLADKLHNARAILLDLRTHGDALWSRFKTGEGASVRWYYNALAEAFEARRDDLGPAAQPFLGDFRRTVAAIDALAHESAGR